MVEVDGVLECGNPPGPITIKSLLNLISSGNMVILVEKIDDVWARTDLQGHLLPGFVMGETLDEKLNNIRKIILGMDAYILVGRPEDEEIAMRAGFEYMSPNDFYNRVKL